MSTYWLALVSAGVTQAVNIGVMWVKGRRQAKGDRISDLLVAQSERFADMREDSNRRFDEARADSDKKFADMTEDMNRRFDDARADSDKKFADLLALITAQGQDIKALGADVKALELNLTGDIKALELNLTEKFTDGLTDLRTEMHKGFRDHGERLARIETRIEFSHPAPAPDHTPADSEAA